MDIYEPAEDSFLLQKAVRHFAVGRVLDMGTGSGIQAFTAAKCLNVREVLAVDINKDALEEVEKTAAAQKFKKVKTLKSNLFENVEGCFNTIIFNPPYLPQDKLSGKIIKDEAIYGGKKGWEIIDRFLSGVAGHLFSNGEVLLLFSSFTNPEKVQELIRGYLLQGEEVEREKVSFEELIVYKITKTPLLLELERKGIEEIRYFTHGKRGDIFVGEYALHVHNKKFLSIKKERRKIAIKVKREDSYALGSMENEAKWLPVLNREGIGPRFLFSGKDYFVYEFVEGEFISNWISKNDKKQVQKVLEDVLKQCRRLDELKLNKEELHHPQKHILIGKDSVPVMIDFERCRQTESPQNVTQFLEFLGRISELKEKGIVIKREIVSELAKSYKEEYSAEEFKTILSLLN